MKIFAPKDWLLLKIQGRYIYSTAVAFHTYINQKAIYCKYLLGRYSKTVDIGLLSMYLFPQYFWCHVNQRPNHILFMETTSWLARWFPIYSRNLFKIYLVFSQTKVCQMWTQMFVKLQQNNAQHHTMPKRKITIKLLARRRMYSQKKKKKMQEHAVIRCNRIKHITRIFAGFRSLCTIPSLCRYCRAFAAIETTSIVKSDYPTSVSPNHIAGKKIK